MNLGALLRTHRERHAIPRYWLAYHSGISEGEIVRIECGELEPTAEQRQALAHWVPMSMEDRLQWLRGDVLSDREIDAVVLGAIEAGDGTYEGIQAALAAARAAKWARVDTTDERKDIAA